MLSSISSAAVHRAAGLFTLLAAVAAPGTAAWAAGPFQAFDGKWKGGGTVTADGNQERIRCPPHYKISGGGNALHINVNCASDSYRVTIVSSVVAKGSTFSGSWRETTRQLSGEVSGRIPELNTFQASLQTIGGGLQIGARSNGQRQAIAITSQGSDIQGASIILDKR